MRVFVFSCARIAAPDLLKRAVVVRVIEVPMGIDDELDRVLAETGQCLAQHRPHRLHERIDDDFSVTARENDHVAARSRQHRQAIGELEHLDWHLRHRGSTLGQRVARWSRWLPHRCHWWLDQ